MQHLDSERLAAFDDTPPTADELAHFAQCAECRAERSAYTELARLAADERHAVFQRDEERLSDWASLSRALRTEGLLTSAADHRVPETPLVVRALDGSGERIARTLSTEAPTRATIGAPSPRRATTPLWLRSAAAVLLIASGMVAGRLSVGASAIPFAATFATSFAALSSASSAGSAARQDDTSPDPGAFGSISQATDVLNSAQRQYEQASLWLAANDTTVRASDVYRARLAALDQMMAASRAALREAPQDPVLNRYYLAASNARQATLQQLSSALPVDKSIEGY